jgi:hypothetical protein
MLNFLKNRKGILFLFIFLALFLVFEKSHAEGCEWRPGSCYNPLPQLRDDSNCPTPKPDPTAAGPYVCCCSSDAPPSTDGCVWQDGVGADCPSDNPFSASPQKCGKTGQVIGRCCCAQEPVYDPPPSVEDIVDWVTEPFKTLGGYLMSVIQWAIKAVSKILLMLLAVVVGIGVFVAAAMSALALYVFDAILEALINVPIIGAEVVTSMWTFVRDFANLFFILFFVIIGLATILKIESYKFQKTLPLLIIMALLVNFSLVLVGLVVDMGNILTGLFLDGVQGKAGGWNGVLSLGASYTAGIIKIFSIEGDLGEVWAIGMGYISYGIVLVLFFFAMCCIFWVILFIFFWRIAILWTLAILSPLAFVSYIFVSTRQAIWSRWFKALVQWSFIAVPILFFMVLAFAVVTTVPSSIEGIQNSLGADPSNVPDMESPDSLKDPMSSGFQGFIINLVSVMIPPIIALIMMILGITISMTFAPEGAQSAVNASHVAGAWAGNTVRRSAPGQATERFLRQRLEGTPLRGLVGGRGAWAREMVSEIRKQTKLMEGLSHAEQQNMVNDSSLDRRSRDAMAAAYFDLRTSKNKPISEEMFTRHEARAERGGADMDKARAQNPTYRIADDPSFNEALNNMRSVGDFSGLTREAFANPTGDPRMQARIVQLLERMTNLSAQQTRKLAENIDPGTRRAAVNAMGAHSAAWRAQATAEGRTVTDINESEANFNTHFGT